MAGVKSGRIQMTNGDLRTILDEALEDERKAEATYAAVLTKFGEVRPFSNIIDAERRHSSAIERQMARLGFPIPPWMSEEQPARTAAVISDFATQSYV
jgi:hypothetical protein